MIARIVNYTFVPATKKITLKDVQTVELPRVQYIKNLTRGTTLYSYTNSSFGTVSLVDDNTVQISHSTAGMLYTDDLEITYDFFLLEPEDDPATGTNQIAGNTLLESLDDKIPTGLTVTGTRLQVELPPGGSGLTDTELRATPVPMSLASVPLPTGASTAALQSTGNTSLATLAGAVSGTEFQVDVITLPSLPAGTNNIGDVDVLTLPAITGTVTANAGTDLNTSALALEATLQSVKTAVETIDNAISGSEMQVDVLTMPTTTVQATDLDIRNLVFATDKVDISGSSSVGVTGTFWQATQPVSGTVAATQSGTWNIGSITTLPSLSAGTNNIGDIDVLSLPAEGTISTNNSSTATLGAGAAFTGAADEITNYSCATIYVISNVASATDGLSIQQSNDGTNWDILDVYTIPAATGKTFGVQCTARYLRVVYTNGAGAQASFRLQTIYHKYMQRNSTVRPQDGRSNENDFSENLAYLMALNASSTWDRVKSTSGALWTTTPNVLFKGRASTFRTPGRAGTAGQKILSLHNATGSSVTVNVTKVTVDTWATVVKAITVAPPIIRLWKVTVLPTNGTALAKTKIGGTTTSNASVTVLGDTSADGTGSATTLTATLPAGTFIAQEAAPRFITAAGYEMSDRVTLVETGESITLAALEGVVVFLDYTLATQNPTTDMWMATIEWTES